MDEDRSWVAGRLASVHTGYTAQDLLFPLPLPAPNDGVTYSIYKTGIPPEADGKTLAECLEVSRA